MYILSHYLVSLDPKYKEQTWTGIPEIAENLTSFRFLNEVISPHLLMCLYS